MANNLIQYLDVTLDDTLKVVGSTSIGSAVRLSDGSYKLRVHAAGVNANTDSCYLACQLPNSEKTQLKLPFDLKEGFTFEKTSNGVDYYLATFDINVAALKYVGKVNCNVVVVTDTGETITSEGKTYAKTTIATSGTFTFEVTRSSNYSEVLYTDDDEYTTTEVHVEALLNSLSNDRATYVKKENVIQKIDALPTDVSTYNGMYLLVTSSHKLYYINNNVAKELIDFDDVLTTSESYTDSKVGANNTAILNTIEANKTASESADDNLQEQISTNKTNCENNLIDAQAELNGTISNFNSVLTNKIETMDYQHINVQIPGYFNGRVSLSEPVFDDGEATFTLVDSTEYTAMLKDLEEKYGLFFSESDSTHIQKSVLPEDTLYTTTLVENLPNNLITKDNLEENLPSKVVTDDNITAKLPSDVAKTSDISTAISNIDYSAYAKVDESGNKLEISMDSTTYVVTIKLMDKNNNVLDTDTFDLPLESVVTSGTYDKTNKKITLTLHNGTTVDIPVSDLTSGLQSEINSDNKLSADYVDGLKTKLSEFTDDLGSTPTHTHEQYALTNHNHNDVYALINHTHDGTYALADHNHDGVYLKSADVESKVSSTTIKNIEKVTALPDSPDENTLYIVVEE